MNTNENFVSVSKVENEADKLQIDTENLNKKISSISDKLKREQSNRIDKIRIGRNANDLKGNIFNNFTQLNDEIKEIISKKLGDYNKGEKLQNEKNLDNFIAELGKEINLLINNLIKTMDQSSLNENFYDLEAKGKIKLTNVIKGVQYLDKKRIVEPAIMVANDEKGWMENFARGFISTTMDRIDLTEIHVAGIENDPLVIQK